MEGTLFKWTNVVKGYQYRYCILDDNQAILSYYRSKEKMIKGERRGCVRLKGAIIGIDTEVENTFKITVDQKNFHFKAQDAEERQRWVSSLEDTILKHTYKKRFNKKNNLFKLPTLEGYNRKLEEAKTYLSILDNHIQIINNKISDTEDVNYQQQLVEIKVKTLTLIDTVKQTINLLILTKNNILLQNKEIDLNLETKNNSNLTSNCYIELNDNSDTIFANSTVSSSLEKENSKNGLIQFNQNKIVEKTVDSNLVPETSYSSSEDEDCFFDAEDENLSTFVECDISKIQEKKTINTSLKLYKEDKNNLNEVNEDYKIFDACYEDDENEDDFESLEGNGFVISHLISQVKIGMDLTKVILPTFILERRSLLEMYADFFAHPDLFISIADFETPEQRFIQAVRWYLSAFHAGRKSSVAKKPYNPILGEIFKCYWDIPNTQEEARCVKDGPVPWAKTNNLSFIAEQVSHHPPISAFYAEHIEKRIMCICSIYTKSKFLGLSIGVHNIGNGSVHLLDYNEEYVYTFPSAYGRSILTVPWIELGGQVKISCEKTGYSANIEFLTKPFYGGKKNRIVGEVFNSDRKSIVNISGEWNGVINAKYANGKNEIFVNTKEMNVIKKKVKSIKDQEQFESRRLWKDVTFSLKNHNVDKATNAKSLLEMQQRELVKQRLLTNTVWKNRVFHKSNDNWLYNSPMNSRKN